MTALGIVCCYIMGRSLAWNWLSLVSCVFLVLFTFGLYYIPESPPWLVYNEEEDLAFKSMAMIRWFAPFLSWPENSRGDEYDASDEIQGWKVSKLVAGNELITILTGCVGPTWEQGDGDEPPRLRAGRWGAWDGGVQIPRAASATSTFAIPCHPYHPHHPSHPRHELVLSPRCFSHS